MSETSRPSRNPVGNRNFVQYNARMTANATIQFSSHDGVGGETLLTNDDALRVALEELKKEISSVNESTSVIKLSMGACIKIDAVFAKIKADKEAAIKEEWLSAIEKTSNLHAGITYGAIPEEHCIL